METIREPVTGREQVADSSSPLSALSQFYRALNARDIALMEQNWDSSDEAVMDNPLGGIRRGWAEIASVYRGLFGASSRYSFEFYDYTLHRYGEIFIAIGRERGQLVMEDAAPLKLTIRTTRIFRLTNGRWRQLHHHGSIDDADMLVGYKQAVLKRAA